jgi:hypothetical protein
MRHVLVGLVFASGIASADPADYAKPWERENRSALFLDIDGGWERLHPPNGLTYRAEYLRIAPSISLNRMFYLGAAIQLGNIYSAYGRANGALPPNISDEQDGSTIAGQVFLGVRHQLGIFSVGGELAPTVRETSAGMNHASGVDVSYVTTIELHGRVDLWATPNFSVGVMAGMDIASIRDFQVALALGFHLAPYDAMAR